MAGGFSDDSIAEITALLEDYFDGLHDGDLDKFERVFHPNAHLYSSDGDNVTDWPRAEYFDVIRARKSACEQGLRRHDAILSIHKAGPNTALATVNCAIPPRYFTDYLTLLRIGGKWRIISKTFHVDTHE
jgi:hypothetical protein